MEMQKNKTVGSPVYLWIINHDESRVFIVAYIGLAVILSAFVSLFWLLVVVGVHFGFEYIRQRHLAKPVPAALNQSLWELRLDIALVAFAMVIALYMEYVIGVAGLRLAPRLGRAVTAGSRGTARFAAWTRVLRAVLLSLDDAAQVARAAVLRRNRKKMPTDKKEPQDSAPMAVTNEADTTPTEKAPADEDGWSAGDSLIALFFAASIVLLLLAPILTDHTAASALRAMLAEFHPLP